MKSSENIKNSLSQPRLSVYINQTQSLDEALELYRWNAQISSALFTCIQVCEVVIRNAVSEALCNTYGNQWVWDATFSGRLPTYWKNTLQSVANKRNNRNVRKRIDTIDKAIPEFTFAFWQSIFTSRFDVDIWNNQLTIILPNIGSSQNISVANLREQVYRDMDKIRELRNRIAHHETITKRNLQDDLDTIMKTIGYRDQDTLDWLLGYEQVSGLLRNRP